MSQDAERIKTLVTFKKRIEKKIEKLASEIKELEATLEMVNSILREKGFKRAELAKEHEPVSPETPATMPEAIAEKRLPQHRVETENVIPLKTAKDELLAIMYVNQDSLHILPDESKNFDVNTPPFNHFLVERVLVKMQERDGELVRAGQLTSDKMFSYSILREGDFIREIVIKNVDANRLRELKSSIRWTLEKMHEKMKD
ncbi:MAG: hypothetical protein ACUVUE_04880 [Candidatus Bathycorpusculaceae bacterium]